jgi:hypothetical protein
VPAVEDALRGAVVANLNRFPIVRTFAHIALLTVPED